MSHTYVLGDPVRRRRRGSSRAGRILARVLVIVLSAGLAAAVPMNPAQASTIGSTGPLSSIDISPDLNCDVRYVGDSEPQFFGGSACATLVALDGVLYGPAVIPAGSGANPRTAFTPVSQTGPTGTGSAADPYRIVTVVDLGTSGVRLTQTDIYQAGSESYSTTVRLQDSSGSSRGAEVYRAADCYVADSDNGFGRVTEGAVACVSSSDSDRVAQWIPVTAGSHYYEAGYGEVWRHIGSQRPFPDTCRCEEDIDNGAGLSWTVRVPANGAAQVTHLTAFSPDTEQVDSDGDGLLDAWETDGYDANADGIVDVDLPAMGARPDHKDLFVEIDHMVRPGTCFWFFCWGGRSFAPDRGAIDDTIASMAAAPVSNPDGTTGIRLHVDGGPGFVMNPINGATWGTRSRANRVPHRASLGSFSGSSYDWTEFNALRASNLEQARRDVFHYAIYADTYGGSGSSGIAQVTNANFEGDSFLVTDGGSGWGPGGFTRRQEAGTFMHEFGHTLALRHGGGDNINNKPNYLSIMSYLWQLGSRPLDYSRSKLNTLQETALVETAGIPGATGTVGWYCGGARRSATNPAAGIDWNCNGVLTSAPQSRDVTNDGATDALVGYDDWSNLVFDGGAVGAFGAGDLNDQNPPIELTPADEPTAEELREADAFAADGDGSVSLLGPSVVFTGVADQEVLVDVGNVGAVPAGYTLRLSGLPGVTSPVAVTDVPAYTDRRVSVPIDATGLAAGTYPLVATLSRPGSSEVLSRSDLEVVVPDLDDPAQRDRLADALERLRESQPGLPEALRRAFLESGEAASEEDGVVNTAPPTFDAPQVGRTVAVTPGTWSPDGLRFAYRWLLDGEQVGTGTTLKVRRFMANRELVVEETASGRGEPVTVPSAAQSVAPAVIVIRRDPRLTGEPVVGGELVVRTGRIRPPANLSYQWLRNGYPVRGRTRDFYTLRKLDRGSEIAVRVTYAKRGFATQTRTTPVVKIRGR